VDHKRKIVLTGASGVGKTTLAKELAQRLGLPFIPEIGRQLCLAKGFQRIGDIPEGEQENFKREVLEAQIKHESDLSEFIADRSAIDCWVLWQRWNICTAMTYDTESYYERARAQAESYSHIIYVPPLFAIAEDEFRWTDADYIKQINRIVLTTLFDWNLLARTYTVQSADFEQRVREVADWLAE
jgi:predicted ATPase